MPLRERANKTYHQSGGVESNVTRLLVSIKKLLEGLENWSKGEVTDAQISDLYVRFGNDFNAAVFAFDSCGIDMAYVHQLSTVIPGSYRSHLRQRSKESAR